jgi:hypothetical protein
MMVSEVREPAAVRREGRGVKTHCLFGVEQEDFILRADGAAPDHADVDRLYGILCGDGFHAAAASPTGVVLAIARSTPWGQVVVANDAFTNVLEVAFPPLEDLEVFCGLFSETYDQLHEALTRSGLEMRPGGAMDPGGTLHARPKGDDPDGSRLRDILARPTRSHPLFRRELPACVAATQVSLGVPHSEAVNRLPWYYHCEPLVPLLFGNSPEFNGVRGRCMRPLAWMANFAADHPLLGMPTVIPCSLEQYAQARRDAAVRDYSFVSLRAPGRVEFRSACSQDSLAEIVRLIRFRLAVDLASNRAFTGCGRDSRERFIAACTHGAVDSSASLCAELGQVDPCLGTLAERLEGGAKDGASAEECFPTIL